MSFVQVLVHMIMKMLYDLYSFANVKLETKPPDHFCHVLLQVIVRILDSAPVSGFFYIEFFMCTYM